jgi:hypothetical protein
MASLPCDSVPRLTADSNSRKRTGKDFLVVVVRRLADVVSLRAAGQNSLWQPEIDIFQGFLPDGRSFVW